MIQVDYQKKYYSLAVDFQKKSRPLKKLDLNKIDFPSLTLSSSGKLLISETLDRVVLSTVLLSVDTGNVMSTLRDLK